ncbi:unnamed protein product, partial [Tetraodon nigroviridis]
PHPNTTSNRRLQQTQAQVEEVSVTWAHPAVLRSPHHGTRPLISPLPPSLLPSFPPSLQVVDIMRVNVDKVLERDQKLSELDDRADALQAGASQFESCAAKLKNKYWWKNCKV